MINAVLVQITPQQVEQGFYTVRDGVVTITDAKGVPLSDDGLPISRKIGPRQTAEDAAQQLIRNAYSGFERPLTYGEIGWR